MNTDLTEKQHDSLERILGMSEADIMDMPYEYMLELIDNFESELLIREVVARGCNKNWQIAITQRIQAVYERWLNTMDWPYRQGYIQEGHNIKMGELFKNINYDIHSNRLIKTYQDPRLPPLGEGKPIGYFDLDEVIADNILEDNENLTNENKKLTEENKKLRKENKALKQQLKEHQSEEPAKEIEWHNKVRLELLLRLLENSGTELQKVVKTRVAEVMQSVTGLPISTCKNYCTNRDLSTKTHEEEILKLNSKLRAIGIDILL